MLIRRPGVFTLSVACSRRRGSDGLARIAGKAIGIEQCAGEPYKDAMVFEELDDMGDLVIKRDHGRATTTSSIAMVRRIPGS